MSTEFWDMSAFMTIAEDSPTLSLIVVKPEQEYAAPQMGYPGYSMDRNMPNQDMLDRRMPSPEDWQLHVADKAARNSYNWDALPALDYLCGRWY